jgi:two-component system OmpR family sensor kinase
MRSRHLEHLRRHHEKHHRFFHHPRRVRLQRRVFLWFGLTILATLIAVSSVMWGFGPGSPRFQSEFSGILELARREYAAAFGDRERLAALSENVASAFHADIQVEDASGKVLVVTGAPCERGFELEVKDGERRLGTVLACRKARPHAGVATLLAALAAAALVLWGASAFIARRLTRPLDELERVTREIGAGNLAARVRLGRHQTGEVGSLADSVNEMASRIERQLREERALLAAVSHEIRSPLARLRMLSELARSGNQTEARLSEIEAEIEGIVTLIGKLLASSRLEFDALQRKTLNARQLAARALEALSLEPSLLQSPASVAVEGDATLLGRALGNLLENAVRHAGGVEHLNVTTHELPSGNVVRFEVLDRGPGFPAGALTRAFDAFFSAGAPDEPSLGLGLSLVARIARAHGGRAYAENRAEGGARVVLELPHKPE